MDVEFYNEVNNSKNKLGVTSNNIIHQTIDELSGVIESYHDGKDVAMHSLMIQWLSGVQSACSWV